MLLILSYFIRNLFTKVKIESGQANIDNNLYGMKMTRYHHREGPEENRHLKSWVVQVHHLDQASLIKGH